MIKILQIHYNRYYLVGILCIALGSVAVVIAKEIHISLESKYGTVFAANLYVCTGDIQPFNADSVVSGGAAIDKRKLRMDDGGYTYYGTGSNGLIRIFSTDSALCPELDREIQFYCPYYPSDFCSPYISSKEAPLVFYEGDLSAVGSSGKIDISLQPLTVEYSRDISAEIGKVNVLLLMQYAALSPYDRSQRYYPVSFLKSSGRSNDVFKWLPSGKYAVIINGFGILPSVTRGVDLGKTNTVVQAYLRSAEPYTKILNKPLRHGFDEYKLLCPKNAINEDLVLFLCSESTSKELKFMGLPDGEYIIKRAAMRRASASSVNVSMPSLGIGITVSEEEAPIHFKVDRTGVGPKGVRGQ